MGTSGKQPKAAVGGQSKSRKDRSKNDLVRSWSFCSGTRLDHSPGHEDGWRSDPGVLLAIEPGELSSGWPLPISHCSRGRAISCSGVVPPEEVHFGQLWDCHFCSHMIIAYNFYVKNKVDKPSHLGPFQKKNNSQSLMFRLHTHVCYWVWCSWAGMVYLSGSRKHHQVTAKSWCPHRFFKGRDEQGWFASVCF